MVYYKSWDGLTALSASTWGRETLGVGIRPYGLHAGNLASVVAYPYLFLENFQLTQKKSPSFTFQVWLNDIEPKTYVGADGLAQSADWANMYPGSKTFQFTPAPDGFKGSLTDYWQPAIEGIIRGTIGRRFPDVKLEFRRASELVVTPEFEKVVIGCLNKAEDVRKIINKWNFGVARVQGPSSFVWPICPECQEPRTNPKLEQVGGANSIIVPQKPNSNGSVIVQKPVQELFWAVQFRMLHAARLAAIKPDIWFMGMDHVPTSMGELMQDLASLFNIDKYSGVFLHAPLLFAKGDKKLSKSLGNAVYISIHELIDALRDYPHNGLNVQNAPVSSDIMSIGSNLLPSHMVGCEQNLRSEKIMMEKKYYEISGNRKAFRNDNQRNKVSNGKMARMLGVPHV